MRRLPIYFLIDVSESMVGEQIQQVEEGIATIIKELKSDPYALETVWVSIIVFAGQAKTLVPLQEIVAFYPPRFPIGSGTALSKGLGHLMYELRQNIIKTTHHQKGDWKPIIFLFTDGVPTDDTQKAIAEWKQNWHRSTNLIAVSFGKETDLHILCQLTETVLLFKNTNPNSYKHFFKWITASIKTNSMGVENNQTTLDLPQIDGDTITKIDLTKQNTRKTIIDNNFAVMAAKCQNTKKPYLIKYQKILVPSSISDFQTVAYKLVGAYQVDQTYFELSDETNTRTTINTDELIGAPTCPCCGNQYGLAMCSCGTIHCIGTDEINTCPSCKNQGIYGFSASKGFDINRTQG